MSDQATTIHTEAITFSAGEPSFISEKINDWLRDHIGWKVGHIVPFTSTTRRTQGDYGLDYWVEHHALVIFESLGKQV